MGEITDIHDPKDYGQPQRDQDIYEPQEQTAEKDL
jgi:hypothetical protein